MSASPQKMLWFGSYTDKHKHTMKASGFDDNVSLKRTGDKKYLSRLGQAPFNGTL